MNVVDSWLTKEIEGLVPDFKGLVFPDAAPKGTGNPCLVYQLVEGDPELLLDAGPSEEGVLGYQVRIYAARRREASGYREVLGQAFQNRCQERITVEVLGQAFEWAGLQNTYERESESYGALAAMRIHWRRV